jgi:hypothetical protein
VLASRVSQAGRAGRAAQPHAIGKGLAMENMSPTMRAGFIYIVTAGVIAASGYVSDVVVKHVAWVPNYPVIFGMPLLLVFFLVFLYGKRGG